MFKTRCAASVVARKAPLLFLSTVMALVCGCAAPARVVDRDQVPPDQRRLLVISVDGMRPDVMLRAKAPTLRRLMDQGAFTCYGQTTDLAKTLPSHVSMLTGLQPKDHGVLINWDPPAGSDVLAGKSTLLDLAHEAGRTTALVAGKSKFSVFNRAKNVDWWHYPPGGSTNCTEATVGQWAMEIIRQHRPQVMFVHFTEMDTVGHREGWGSPSQVATLTQTDQAIGQILAELKRQGTLERTLVIVTADHGGAWCTHGGTAATSRYIPFIAVGPGVRSGYDLTLVKDLSVRIEDTFATGLEWLEIDRPAGVYGKPVLAIYQNLPTTVPATAPAGATPSTTAGARSKVSTGN